MAVAAGGIDLDAVGPHDVIDLRAHPARLDVDLDHLALIRLFIQLVPLGPRARLRIKRIEIRVPFALEYDRGIVTDPRKGNQFCPSTSVEHPAELTLEGLPLRIAAGHQQVVALADGKREMGTILLEHGQDVPQQTREVARFPMGVADEPILALVVRLVDH
jgi:hypothetical protein